MQRKDWARRIVGWVGMVGAATCGTPPVDFTPLNDALARLELAPTSPPSGVSIPGPETPVILQPAPDCSGVAAAMRGAVLADNTRRLDDLAAATADLLAPESAAPFCRGGMGGGFSLGCGGRSGALAMPEDGGGDWSNGGFDAGTRTNNQRPDVDEADLWDNDGRYFYLAAGGALQVIDGWPAEEARIIGALPINGQPRGLFLVGSRVVVVADVVDADTCTDPSTSFTTGASTSVSIIDVADPSSPRLVRQLSAAGDAVAARRVGDQAHFVIEMPNHLSTTLEVPDVDGIDVLQRSCMTNPNRVMSEVQADIDIARRSNAARTAASELDDMLPPVQDTVYAADGSVAATRSHAFGCSGLLVPQAGVGLVQVGVLSVRVADDASFTSTAITGARGDVFASSDNLYLAERQLLESSGDERTVIHKLALGDGIAAPTYRGSIAIPGRLINSLAMDEHEGALRVAATEGVIPDSVNAVWVIGEVAGAGPGLQVLGSIQGIAPEEDIRAVRFAGDRGWVVTFRRTDPLFELDLSDAANPRITGELEVDGFSTYLHPLDDDHLLTVGFEVIGGESDRPRFDGVMLQLFDVSDPAQPVRLHAETIGTRGTTSDATADHLAFTYLASQGLLALPVAICSGQEWEAPSFNGAQVYSVSIADGFTLLGGVDHSGAAGGAQDCTTWWSSPNSGVKRTAIMVDDGAPYLFSLSSGAVRVNPVSDLTHDAANITLPPDSAGQVQSCVPPPEEFPPIWGGGGD